MAILCKTATCQYNVDGICTMYDEERTDEIRTIEFYEKWNPKRIAPTPPLANKREGDM